MKNSKKMAKLIENVKDNLNDIMSLSQYEACSINDRQKLEIYELIRFVFSLSD